MTKIRLLGIAVTMLFFWNNSEAQIYAQGKNLNNQNTYFLNVELVKAPLNPSKFIAKVDFYGRRKEVDWFLKEGVEHKAFVNKDEMIAYLENNGWFYLHVESIKARSSEVVRQRYYFRKSMAQLSQEYETNASNQNTGQ